MKSLSIVISTMALSIPAFSCDCDGGELSVDSIYKVSSNIFSAKVLRVENTILHSEYKGLKFYYQEITMEIIEQFKGDTVNQLIVMNEGFSNCGTNFEVGEEYLIYPYNSTQFGSFMVHQCHRRIGRIAYMKDEIEELRKLND